MLDDIETRYSDAWWFRRLVNKMYARPVKPDSRLGDSRKYTFSRVEWLDYLWSYHTGEPPLSHLSSQWADATKEFLRLSKNNFAGLVTTSLLNRVQFHGVTEVTIADPDGDDDVRRFLSSNGSFFSDAEEYAAALGQGYILIGFNDDPNGPAIATAEDPRQMVAITDPTNENIVRAALKLYRDEDAGEHVAAVYIRGENGTKDRVTTYVRQGKVYSGLFFSPKEWKVDPDRSMVYPDSVQGLGVPVVPITSPKGIGEIEPHLDLFDRITNGIADRLWAVKYQIFMQRAVRSDDLPLEDEAGRPIDYNEVFAADPGAMWLMPKDAEIWESKQLQVDQILAPVRDDLRELSAVTGTPLPVLMAESTNGSAEGATLARETMSFKAEDRTRRWSPAAIRVARLGLAYSGLPEKANAEFEAIWAPVERLSLSQRMEAGRAARDAEVPLKATWADVMQMPPATVKRWALEYDEEQLMAQLDQTPAQPAAPAAPTPGAPVPTEVIETENADEVPPPPVV